MGYSKLNTKIEGGIISTLQLLDQNASSRLQTYTSRDKYMSNFRENVQKVENHLRSLEEGQRNHKRISFVGDAVIITESALVKGHLENLSSGGAYITGDSGKFNVQETVRLKLKPQGQSQSLKSSATVVRIEELPDGLTGYALCFNPV